MTVIMPPRRAPTQLAFHNKPYYPDLTVRRSTRLALNKVPVARVSPRRQPTTTSSTTTTTPQPTTTTTTNRRRRIPVVAHTTTLKHSRAAILEVPPPPPPIASSSKRKADSSLTEEDAHGDGSPSISSRRKKRKDNAAAVEKPPPPPPSSRHQMRATTTAAATLKNSQTRARSSTNKYGTRSAHAVEPVHVINVDPAPVPPQLLPPPPPSGSSPPVSQSPRLSSPPQETNNDADSSHAPPPPNPAETIITEDTSPQTPQPVSSEACNTPEPNTSYVTYTDLTPFSPEAQFNIPLHPTFTPSSILSELHDDFSFSSDPDLDPAVLLTPSDIGFPQPLQDQMGATTTTITTITGAGAAAGCDNGSIDVHEWNRVARQKENDEARRQKIANQRRDRLWTNLTDQKYREFVRNHGIDEVRARVKADTQKAAQLYHQKGLNSPPVTVTTTTIPSRPPITEQEPESDPPAIRPSFEMYSPECEVDEKLDGDTNADAAAANDDDEDDEDDEDSDESIEDDTAPDPNFDLPPPLIVSPLKANPLLGGRITMFGTPPFLERRQAWGGGMDLINLSMNYSVHIQQSRPPRKYPEPPLGSKLPPPSSFPMPSSRPPPPPPPPLSHPHTHTQTHTLPPSPSEQTAPQFQQIPEHNPNNTPDFTNVDPEAYADPAIMQAIIASMSPPGGIDFNFGNGGWVPDHHHHHHQVDTGTGTWQNSGGLEMTSSFPRCSPVLTSSSTLHSALG